MMRSLSYLSVCSGIEAATVAWHPLGFLPVAFSEIEAFPCAVLAHHYPSVPNWGDMTRFKEWPDAVFNVLVGGTPCQSFSIAGLRKGLADPRGNLALTYLAIADRYRPEWVAWENVPGVFSSWTGDQPPGDLVEGQRWESTETSDFGGFIAALSELGYGVAWRVLDAQYVRVDGFLRAVPQRRERVIVIGHSSGDWRRAAAVLFDAESLRGNSPPRREQGERPARGAQSGTGVGGWPAEVASTLNAHYGDKWGLEDQHALNGAALFVPGDAGTLDSSKSPHGRLNGSHQTFVAHSLRAEGYDASEDGSGRGTPIIPVYARGVAATLTRGAESAGKGGYAGRRQEDDVNVVAEVVGALAVNSGPNGHDSGNFASNQGVDAGYIIPVAYDGRGREGGLQFEGPHETANIRAASGGSSRSYVAEQWAVRRLTPTECERLQGFPEISKSVRIDVCEGEKREPAKSADRGSQSRSPAPSDHALVHVLIDLERSVAAIHRAGKLLWSASIAQPPSSSPLSMPLGGFVRLVAHMTQTGVPQIPLGGVASQASISSSFPRLSGSESVSVSGREIDALVSDAEKFTQTVNQCMKSITSPSGRNSQTSELTLATFASCVVAAISSCIPAETRHANSYAVIVETIAGYTNITFRGKPAADGPRYKALGNSMAVNMMRWLGQRIAMVDSIP